MEAKKTTINNLEELREKLSQPLPSWGTYAHDTKTFLTAINSMAVIDRLNSVFGIGVWRIKYEVIDRIVTQRQTKNGIKDVTMVIVKGFFICPHPLIDGHTIEIESYGGNDNDDLGDAYKGACTDCLTKIGQTLEIGKEVWMDRKKGKPNEAPSTQGQSSNQSQYEKTDKDKAIKWLSPQSESWDKCVDWICGELTNNTMTFDELIKHLREDKGRGFSKQNTQILREQIKQKGFAV